MSKSEADYKFKLDHKSLNFTIPFQKSKFTFSQEDIQPFLKSIDNLEYSIDSINIKAFASVEGNIKENERLQINRANNIAKVLQNHQKEIFTLKVEAETAWKDFYEKITKKSRWKFLSKMDKISLSKYLNSNPDTVQALESILSQQRKGLIDLHYTIPITNQNLEYYINKSFNTLQDSLRTHSSNPEKRNFFLRRFETLYEFTYKKVQEKLVKTDVLAKVKMPNYYDLLPSLAEKFVLYGYFFPEVFKNNTDWQNNQLALRKYLFKNFASKLSDEFIYLDCKLKTEELQKANFLSKKQIQDIFDEMRVVRQKHALLPQGQLAQEFDKMNFNLNMLLLNKVFSKNAVKNGKDARKSINLVWLYYQHKNLMTDSLAVKLAKIAEFYGSLRLAGEILEPYTHIDDILAYKLNLEYHHPSNPFSKSYYDYLIESSKILPSETWCNLFLSNCNIPFQAFDHEELRNIFCKKCQEKNKFLQGLNK